jgi:uncharacterized protein
MLSRSAKRHFYPRLAAFFALAFAWSWVCWLLSVWVKPYSDLLAVLPGLLAGFGPGMAAIAVVGNVDGPTLSVPGLHVEKRPA